MFITAVESVLVRGEVWFLQTWSQLPAGLSLRLLEVFRDRDLIHLADRLSGVTNPGSRLIRILNLFCSLSLFPDSFVDQSDHGDRPEDTVGTLKIQPGTYYVRLLETTTNVLKPPHSEG